MFGLGTTEILVLLLVGFFVLMVVALIRKKSNAPPVSTHPQLLSEEERTINFRTRRNHFREEQAKILGMVESAKISAEEGDRLLNTLERETATMACPFCNEDIRIEAVKCRHCGSFLYEGVATPKRLTKSRDRVLAGVCGGLAEYMELDPTLVRVLTAVIIFLSGFTGLIFYLIAVFIIPKPR